MARAHSRVSAKKADGGKPFQARRIDAFVVEWLTSHLLRCGDVLVREHLSAFEEQRNASGAQVALMPAFLEVSVESVVNRRRTGNVRSSHVGLKQGCAECTDAGADVLHDPDPAGWVEHNFTEAGGQFAEF
jgi:hypothetical protein